jgi:hypothetical protein
MKWDIFKYIVQFLMTVLYGFIVAVLLVGEPWAATLVWIYVTLVFITVGFTDVGLDDRTTKVIKARMGWGRDRVTTIGTLFSSGCYFICAAGLGISLFNVLPKSSPITVALMVMWFTLVYALGFWVITWHINSGYKIWQNLYSAKRLYNLAQGVWTNKIKLIPVDSDWRQYARGMVWCRREEPGIKNAPYIVIFSNDCNHLQIAWAYEASGRVIGQKLQEKFDPLTDGGWCYLPNEYLFDAALFAVLSSPPLQ